MCHRRISAHEANSLTFLVISWITGGERFDSSYTGSLMYTITLYRMFLTSTQRSILQVILQLIMIDYPAI